MVIPEKEDMGWPLLPALEHYVYKKSFFGSFSGCRMLPSSECFMGSASAGLRADALQDREAPLKAIEEGNLVRGSK